ncbi:MAG: acyl carrier protein phosphodiesterase [Flavobacterium sp.]|jgi:acyl carrier protein phosphodiesterase|uniref:acyl carrier protein phosphodiesterase n=1 Tax=Flavobacterium sp. TaxID=239 RepID=UPI0025BB3CFB|nr:acyl carrier protein phosphodiesterase [Flavobacterium sp.]MCA1966033.1 acyl carrier protein phosphodiesterase [Flavobacterium sp.]
MNFLAHIYLSGEDDFVKIGNFMADSIRGSQYLDYPNSLQKGILLHRHIDSFTDAHPIYRKSKHRLHEKYGHYSGVIMDIAYDHFLAKNWSKYSNEKLEDYAADFYQLVQDNFEILTERTKGMLPYMIGRNWLVSYATIAGLEMILFQMDYKTKHRVHMQEAIVEIQDFYTEFESEFFQFFEELVLSCQQKLKELNEIL